MTKPSPPLRPRPVFHFTPPYGWNNDPNGLIWFEGEYHLFYQYHPHDLLWGPMYWGHAVSTDLVHWTHLPIALSPDDIGTIFSGSVVYDAVNTSGLVPVGGLIAVFSFHTQAQGIAYSTDRGRTWTKYAGNPVIPSPGKDFRDPKVFWYARASCWVMVLVAGDHAEFYQSTNLIDWSLTGMFGTPYGARGGVWECPDLFPLEIDGETKWVLIVSVGDGAHSGGSGTQYFVGQFDGRTFTSDNPPEVVLWLDYGADNYASVTYNDTPDGRCLLLGWMNNWSYARNIPAEIWRGSMTVPRELRLVSVPGHGIRLAQTPVAEIKTFRSPLAGRQREMLDSSTLCISALDASDLDIEVDFILDSASEFGMTLANGDCRTVITIDPIHQTLALDRSQSGDTTFHTAFTTRHIAPLPVYGDRVSLRVLLDSSSVEVFAENGITVLTSQIFPDLGSLSLEVFARNGSVTLDSLAIYMME